MGSLGRLVYWGHVDYPDDPLPTTVETDPEFALARASDHVGETVASHPIIERGVQFYSLPHPIRFEGRSLLVGHGVLPLFPAIMHAALCDAHPR